MDEIRLEAPHREVPLTPMATVAIPEYDGVPRLDGNLDDECWPHAVAMAPFSVIDGSATAQEQTHCRLFHDGSRLYLAATLETADVKRLRATLARHDAAVYTDDSFEIFIAGDDPEVDFYQFAVNPLGTTMDLSSDRLLAFEHDWQAAAVVGENAWTVEASIALASLLHQPGPGSTFGLNLCRENRVTGELSGWSPTGESFLRPGRFGQAILLGPAPPSLFTPPSPPSQGGDQEGPSLSLEGSLVPVWNDYGDGVYAARVDASSLCGQVEGLTLRATLRFGKERFEGEDFAGKDDLACRELFAPVQARLEQEGEAQVQFALLRSDGQPLAFYAFRYPVFLPV